LDVEQRLLQFFAHTQVHHVEHEAAVHAAALSAHGCDADRNLRVLQLTVHRDRREERETVKASLKLLNGLADCGVERLLDKFGVLLASRLALLCGRVGLKHFADHGRRC